MLLVCRYPVFLMWLSQYRASLLRVLQQFVNFHFQSAKTKTIFSVEYSLLTQQSITFLKRIMSLQIVDVLNSKCIRGVNVSLHISNFTIFFPMEHISVTKLDSKICLQPQNFQRKLFLVFKSNYFSFLFFSNSLLFQCLYFVIR